MVSFCPGGLVFRFHYSDVFIAGRSTCYSKCKKITNTVFKKRLRTIFFDRSDESDRMNQPLLVFGRLRFILPARDGNAFTFRIFPFRFLPLRPLTADCISVLSGIKTYPNLLEQPLSISLIIAA